MVFRWIPCSNNFLVVAGWAEVRTWSVCFGRIRICHGSWWSFDPNRKGGSRSLNPAYTFFFKESLLGPKVCSGRIRIRVLFLKVRNQIWFSWRFGSGIRAGFFSAVSDRVRIQLVRVRIRNSLDRNISRLFAEKNNLNQVLTLSLK